MIMVNPNKYIRGAVVSALSPLKVWYKRVPKNVDPGTSYILIASQGKQPTEESKTCYDWACQINLQLWVITTQGMPPNVTIDDMEEVVLNAMSDLRIDGWIVQDIRLDNQVDASVETATQSIDNRTLTYNIWLDRRFGTGVNRAVNAQPANADKPNVLTTF